MSKTTMPKVLLAKTPRDRGSVKFEETLIGHTRRVVESFDCLFGSPEEFTRLTREWLRFFKLPETESLSAFLTHGVAACFLHDIGKANSGFQKAIQRPGATQVIYHEHLSGLLLWFREIREWLEGIPHLDANTVLCAVIGHHLRVSHKNLASPLHPDRTMFKVYPEGICDVLDSFADCLKLPRLRGVEIPARWSLDPSPGCFHLKTLCEEIKRSVYRLKRRLGTLDGAVCARMLRAVRAALVLSDSAGSGLVREQKDIPSWIRTAFDDTALISGQGVQEKVIGPRRKQIAALLGGFKWTDFQEAAEHLPDRALLLAPCASGKTLAAWRWIKAHTNSRCVARVIFLYPTRATATEGFRDYVSWAPEAEATLIHGTSSYELADMFDNPEDERYHKDFITEDRLFALAYWQRRIFSATVDQFLGFMQHSYRSTCLLPLLADSVVVVDEVHSFDKGLFSALKSFLREFDVPVLCMTASLSLRRKAELEGCGLEVFPSDPKEFSDLQGMAEMDRYLVCRIEGPSQARTIVEDAVRGSGKRVLWVVNTVDRCQQLARELNALCYHSRFRLDDRKDRHNEVISAFQQTSKPVLAVTTQVCEMSLDLDADVLVSEEAPIAALIQRMGRCNRRARPGYPTERGQVFLYPPEKALPYEEGELTGVEDFLKALDGKTVSQSLLQELLERYGPSEVEVERYAAFLESGPWAMAREEMLRESTDFTVPVILDEDVACYLELRQLHKPVDGLIVPVPRRFGELDNRVAGWLRVAKGSQYQPQYGFFDKLVEGL